MGEAAKRGKVVEARQLLPKEAYTSREWFEREQEELFGRSWQFACLEADVPEAGDYKALQVGRYPLIVIRGADRELRCFHNICRHRGSLVLDGEGNAGRGIRCPYHHWFYSLDGSLRSMPGQEKLYPDIDKSRLGLRPAALDRFRGIVFVHPEPDPRESFASWLGDLPAKAWPHEVEDMREALSLRYELSANWKLFWENAMDGYHLAYLHAHTLGGPDPDSQDWDAAGRHGIFRSTAGPRPLGEDLLKPIRGGDRKGYGSVYYLFPNFGTLPALYTWTTFHVIPVEARRCWIDTRFFVSKDSDRADEYYRRGPGMPELAAGRGTPEAPIALADIAGPPMESGSFHIEDMWICERMQRAMESPVYGVGPMAPIVESQLTFFQRNLMDFVPVERETIR